MNFSLYMDKMMENVDNVCIVVLHTHQSYLFPHFWPAIDRPRISVNRTYFLADGLGLAQETYETAYTLDWSAI